MKIYDVYIKLLNDLNKRERRRVLHTEPAGKDTGQKKKNTELY